MSHSKTSRRGTTRRLPSRQADRIAGRAQAASQRAAHVDAFAMAVAFGATGAAHGRGDPHPRHQAVEPRKLVRRKRVEALRAEDLLVAGQHGHRDLFARLGRASARRAGWGGGAARCTIGCPSRFLIRYATPPARSLPRPSPSGGAEPNTLANTRSNAGTCIRSDTNAARAVQYSLRREIGSTTASASANHAARSAVTGTPASCRRRLNDPATAGRSSPSVLTRNGCGTGVIAGLPMCRAPRRGSRPGPRRT